MRYLAIALALTGCGNELAPTLNAQGQVGIVPASTTDTQAPAIATAQPDTAQTGPQGATGPAGPKGDTGPQGAVGPQGIPGQNGANGVNGKDGKDGAVGATGQAGPQGLPGTTGATGPQGVQGLQGADGGVIVTDLDCTNVPVNFPDGSTGAVSGQVIVYASGARWISFYVMDSAGEFFSERSKVLLNGGLNLQLNLPGGQRDLEFVYGAPPQLAVNSQIVNDSNLYCNKAR